MFSVLKIFNGRFVKEKTSRSHIKVISVFNLIRVLSRDLLIHSVVRVGVT